MSRLENIINTAKKRGHDVRVRDVGFAVLAAGLNDEKLAHKLIFGDDGNEESYKKLSHVKFLVNHLRADEIKRKEAAEAENIAKLIAKNKGKKTDNSSGAITFEENRDGLENQLVEIRALIEELKTDSNDPDPKTMALLIKTEADIRVKLNDKFGAAEKTAEQYIIVQKKFDFVCPYTRHECYQMDKDDAMNKWHLIDDPEYKE